MKKAVKIVLIVVACILVLAILSAGALLLTRRSIMTGPCLVAENGTCLILLGGEPIVLSTSADILDGLSTGDRIVALTDAAVLSSYPGQTGVYAVLRIGRGGDIPADALDTLTGLGWKFQGIG